jgi:hypothetical protein
MLCGVARVVLRGCYWGNVSGLLLLLLACYCCWCGVLLLVCCC